MVTIFDYSDYKIYVRDYIKSLPKNGRGEMAKIAKALRMHPTRVSQIFNEGIELSMEQACALGKHFGMTTLEAEYLLALVQKARAGTQELRDVVDGQLRHLQERAKKLVHRVPRDKILSEEEKAVFYSSWVYSGIRLATSIDELSTLDLLANYFEMPRERVRSILDFLIQTGLCKIENERLTMGPKRTHLEHDSPLVLRHHTNWRLKALSRHERLEADELAYTCPVSISVEDLPVVKEIMTKTIQKFLKTVTDSEPPQVLACLNIDWFKIKS